MTDKADWLAQLKKGDPVVVNWHSYPTNRSQVQKVARMTDTLLETDGRLRFRLNDGDMPGPFMFDTPWITEPTAAQTKKAMR